MVHDLLINLINSSDAFFLCEYEYYNVLFHAVFNTPLNWQSAGGIIDFDHTHTYNSQAIVDSIHQTLVDKLRGGECPSSVNPAHSIPPPLSLPKMVKWNVLIGQL